MYGDYFADSGVEYDGMEPGEELDIKFRPYVPDYAPPAAQEKPEVRGLSLPRPRLRLLEPGWGLPEKTGFKDLSQKKGGRVKWHRFC